MGVSIPLGALSQHRSANSHRRWVLSRTRCPFSLLDLPICVGTEYPQSCGSCRAFFLFVLLMSFSGSGRMGQTPSKRNENMIRMEWGLTRVLKPHSESAPIPHSIVNCPHSPAASTRALALALACFGCLQGLPLVVPQLWISRLVGFHLHSRCTSQR